MAKARALDRRRKSIRNIRKITRTMELISTAQFRRAMDRATAATAYTRRITALVGHLARSRVGSHAPAAAAAAGTEAGDAPGAAGQSRPVRRLQRQRRATGGRPIQANCTKACRACGWKWPASGAFRPSASARFSLTRRSPISTTSRALPRSTCWQPAIWPISSAGELDRLDVVYTKFESASRQQAVVETLLPLGELEGADEERIGRRAAVRVLALGREHFGRGGADEFQGEACSSVFSTRP